MSEDHKRSEKYEQARNSLPDDLKPVFDAFVDDYKFAGTIHHGSPFVSYVILAEMVKAGWRLTGEGIGFVLFPIGLMRKRKPAKKFTTLTPRSWSLTPTRERRTRPALQRITRVLLGGQLRQVGSTDRRLAWR